MAIKEEEAERKIKKGDKVKIYRAGIWYTIGTVTAVEDGAVTARYMDVDEHGVSTWRTITGREKYVELAPQNYEAKRGGKGKKMKIKMRAEVGFSGEYVDVLKIAKALFELSEAEEVVDFKMYKEK